MPAPMHLIEICYLNNIVCALNIKGVSIQ